MIAAIVAVDKNFGIGFNNELLESIPEDLKRFKELTTGNLVMMGSNTWRSLPIKPLPNRYNAIITRNPDAYLEPNDKTIFVFWETATEFLKYHYDEKDGDVFIMGGGMVYEKLLPYCDTIYLTYIWKEHENVDTYFPDFNESEWEIVDASEWKEHNGIPYQFQTYKRIN